MSDEQQRGRVPERTYHYLHATETNTEASAVEPVAEEKPTSSSGPGADSRRARRAAKQAKTMARDQQAAAEPRTVIEDDDPFADELDYERRRGFISRGRRWWRRKWSTYLHEAVPEDDESVEGLPRIFQGWWGRLIMTVIILGLMVFWTLALGSVVFI